MKILNLYAGIGGNRKLWGDDHQITAVEIDPQIAAIYSDFFPNDKMIVGDAHQYLLDHYSEFDFIWASPLCPTHSNMRLLNVYKGDSKPVYPDMTLYQEIIFLKKFFNGKYCVENVIPYYQPLIPPTKILDRHCYWSNFYITRIEISKSIKIKNRTNNNFFEKAAKKKINVEKFNEFKGNKVKLINNMVDENLGLHILNCAQNILSKKTYQTDLFE